jgi:hypothetical protein
MTGTPNKAFIMPNEALKGPVFNVTMREDNEVTVVTEKPTTKKKAEMMDLNLRYKIPYRNGQSNHNMTLKSTCNFSLLSPKLLTSPPFAFMITKTTN